MSTYLENMKWRYATKQFDANKKISKEDLALLLEGIQLSPSSYGLQPYEVLVIKDPETRKKLREYSWDQSQITDSSQLFVIANYKKIEEAYVDNYLKNIAQTRDMKLEDLKGLKDMISNTVLQMPEKMQNEWGQKQAYIALGNLLATAANLKIDACPMEGFEADKYDEILNLSKKGLHTSVIATVGYRHEDDQTQHAAKVRKSTEDLFHHV